MKIHYAESEQVEGGDVVWEESICGRVPKHSDKTSSRDRVTCGWCKRLLFPERYAKQRSRLDAALTGGVDLCD